LSLLQGVRAEALLAPGRPVVVMLSGGRDSTCLLDLAVRIAGAPAVSALHVNYGLRADAAADERHCRELCAALGVTLEVSRPQRPNRGNLQAWAREARYQAAASLAAERGAEVATGHTRSDQVESILYRLASSPSRRALSGMPAREGALVRPLLGYTREDTTAYCRARRLEWREDETNESSAYARGRIRRDLVPALLDVHPGAEHNVLALAEILRHEGAVLDALVDDVLEQRAEVELERLRGLPPALRRLVVQRLADEAAGGLAPGAGRRAEDVVALGDRGTVELAIGNGLRAVAEYGRLRIERLGAAPASTPEAVCLKIPGQAVFGVCEVVCQVGAPARGPGILDRAELGSELLVRAWRAGDRMAPLGLNGTKSLQDLFTARRVPRGRRATVPVVEAGGGEIAWVAGVGTSERFKVTDRTVETVRLMVREPRHGARASAPT
jgi:tRNA(Ile)-lysidine synthase